LQNKGWKKVRLIGVGFTRLKLTSDREFFAFEKLGPVMIYPEIVI
jgi:hypothetical protein